MKVNGIVKAKSQKGNAIKLDDNNWYSQFGSVDANVGDVVDVEYVQNGDFKNIKTLVKSAKSSTNNTINLDRERLIVRQTCIKAAAEYCHGAEYSLLDTAQMMFDWIYAKDDEKQDNTQ